MAKEGVVALAEEGRRKSVLFVGYGLRRDFLRPAGYQRVVQGSIAALALRGYKVAYLELIWTDKKPLDTEVMFKANGKRIHVRLLRLSLKLSYKNEPEFYIKTAKALFNERMLDVLERLNPGFVIVEGYTPWYLARNLAKLMDAKLMLRVHTLLSRCIRCTADKSLSHISWMYASALHVVLLAQVSNWALTFTSADERELRRFFIRRISMVEPTYASLIASPSHATITEIDLDIEPPFLICYRPWKLYVHLAKAMPDIRIVVIGIPKHEFLRAVGLSRDRLPSNLVIPGEVYGRALERLLKNTSLLPIPDRCFSGPCVRLIEGLAFGVPMLATSPVAKTIRGLRPGVHLLVEDRFDRWPRILRYVISHEELRAELGQNAHRFFEEHLRPAIHGRKLEAVLKAI